MYVLLSVFCPILPVSRSATLTSSICFLCGLTGCPAKIYIPTIRCRSALKLAVILVLQEKLAAAEAARKGSPSAEEVTALQQRITKLETQKEGLNQALQAGQAEIAALQVI